MAETSYHPLSHGHGNEETSEPSNERGGVRERSEQRGAMPANGRGSELLRTSQFLEVLNQYATVIEYSNE